MSIWADIFKRFRAPALPNATENYDRRYIDQVLNILRLYFYQLDNLLEQIVSAQPVNVQLFGGAIDAFGRARTSAPFTLFDSQNRFQKNSSFDESTASGGTVTYDANSSTVSLNVTTTSGSEVVRQTYRVFPYQPGKSLLVMNTFVMAPAQSNLRQRVGYFSTQNGVFLELDGSVLYIVKRTYASGAAVDTRVAQADWNGDRLTGSGSSGFTLDITKSQIFWEDFEWLGVGSVRCGFIIDGRVIVAHTFQNANVNPGVYMTTAILPVRYEITATSGIGSAATMKQICSTVISEGGYEKRVALNVARMTATNASIGTSFVPLVSIRLAPGRTQSVVIPDGYSVLPTSSSTVTFEVVMVRNPTLSGASWAATSSNNVQYDISATSYTGGTIVESQFVSASNQGNTTINNGAVYNFDLQLGATISGTSDIYTIAVRALSGTHSAIGSMSFWDLT